MLHICVFLIYMSVLIYFEMWNGFMAKYLLSQIVLFWLLIKGILDTWVSHARKDIFSKYLYNTKLMTNVTSYSLNFFTRMHYTQKHTLFEEHLIIIIAHHHLCLIQCHAYHFNHIRSCENVPLYAASYAKEQTNKCEVMQLQRAQHFRPQSHWIESYFVVNIFLA